MPGQKIIHPIKYTEKWTWNWCEYPGMQGQDQQLQMFTNKNDCSFKFRINVNWIVG